MSQTGWCIDQHLAGESEYVQIDYILDRDIDDIGTAQVTKQKASQQQKTRCGVKWNKIGKDE